MRVIPVEEAIDGENHAASYEEVSTYIENAWRLCVSDCTCRRSRRLMGEGCGHLEKDMCIQLDEGADYFIRTGVGREITKEEAYEILKRAEENGLVHEIQNLDGEGKTDLQLLQLLLLLPQSRKVLHVSGLQPFQLCLQHRRRKVRGMRPVRGELSGKCLAPGKKTVRKNSGPGKGKRYAS